MKATDIMEALTDMDDDVLMRAEMDPPRRHILLLRSLRSAAAACLVLALFLTTLIVRNTFADEMGLRWRVRYREDEVTWLFKDGMEQEGELPNYEPTWLPEGYVLDRSYDGIVRDRMIDYKNPIMSRAGFSSTICKSPTKKSIISAVWTREPMRWSPLRSMVCRESCTPLWTSRTEAICFGSTNETALFFC